MNEDDPDSLKGPGGLTLRQVHEQVRRSVERDRQALEAGAAPAPNQSRWRRFIRYVWKRSNARR